ncbi:putative endonuclease [Salegentibacter echinorum]|uniref:UPF0102 protein SAMN05444483_102425 n=1 Tax=Salegentibacter echinorum TaxID=1073325 RepID=A0A1M5ELS3_SALEC|nr:YraN family protein [Salegentibacter echinorum]SHF80094.1 putative endonuclease [Salegentibacter echinorum]
MAQHNALGEFGERLAENHLVKKGYKILAKNYVHNKAEIDILARITNTLVVVEVKTRSTPDFGDPQSFVKPKQIRQLVKAADFFLNDNNLDLETRFDIVAIIKNKAGIQVQHLEDAFYHFE